MTKTQGILNIMEATGIAEDKQVGESTAFDVPENAVEGALYDIENADDDEEDDDEKIKPKKGKEIVSLDKAYEYNSNPERWKDWQELYNNKDSWIL